MNVPCIERPGRWTCWGLSQEHRTRFSLSERHIEPYLNDLAIRHTCEGYDFPVYFTVYYLILTQWGIKVIWFVFVITVFPTYRYVSVYGAETCAFANAKRQRATGLLEMAISSPFSWLGHQTNTVHILYRLFQNKHQNVKLHLSIQWSQIWFIKIVERHCKNVSTLIRIFSPLEK